MNYRKCIKCQIEKPIGEFYQNPKTKIFRPYCYECKRLLDKIHRDKPSTKIKNKEYMREYRKTSKNKEYMRIYRTTTESGKRNAVNHKINYYSKPENRSKRIARSKIDFLIRNGKLLKEPCFFCGESKAESHHPNYDNPLYVIFVCQICHTKITNGAKPYISLNK